MITNTLINIKVFKMRLITFMTLVKLNNDDII